MKSWLFEQISKISVSSQANEGGKKKEEEGEDDAS